MPNITDIQIIRHMTHWRTLERHYIAIMQCRGTERDAEQRREESEVAMKEQYNTAMCRWYGKELKDVSQREQEKCYAEAGLECINCTELEGKESESDINGRDQAAGWQ